MRALPPHPSGRPAGALDRSCIWLCGPMKILLAPVGSHGDVHPFLGMGRALLRAGHEVTVLVNGHFRALVEEAGLRYRECGSDAQFREAVAHPDMWHPTRSLRLLSRYVGELIPDTYGEIERGGHDLVVAHCLAFGARIAEERLGARVVTILLAPSNLRSAYETPRLPGDALLRFLPRPLRRAAFALVDRRIVDPMFGEAVNGFRARLGLAPARRIFDRWWIAERRALGLWPGWFAAPQPDWAPSVRLTDFPLWDEGDLRGVPPEVESFLAAGPPPVVFAPGTAMTQGRRFFEASLEACRRLGARALLLTRHAEQVPAPLPGFACLAPYAPFSLLLSRVAAIVHHGGVGTMAQAFASGVPQLVKPLAYDQFDNGDRVRRLGCGAMLPDRRYTPRRAAAALRRLLDAPLRCGEIAARVRGSPGLDATVRAILAEGPSA